MTGWQENARSNMLDLQIPRGKQVMKAEHTTASRVQPWWAQAPVLSGSSAARLTIQCSLPTLPICPHSIAVFRTPLPQPWKVSPCDFWLTNRVFTCTEKPSPSSPVGFPFANVRSTWLQGPAAPRRTVKQPWVGLHPAEPRRGAEAPLLAVGFQGPPAGT